MTLTGRTENRQTDKFAQKRIDRLTEQRKDEQKDRQKGNRLQKTYRTEGFCTVSVATNYVGLVAVLKHIEIFWKKYIVCL
jgi:hypothetical protein